MKKIPDHGYPSEIFLNVYNVDEEHNPEPPKPGAFDGDSFDGDIHSDRSSAIRKASGADYGYHEENIVAVYQLVEIVEIKQRTQTISHKVIREPRRTRSKR